MNVTLTVVGIAINGAVLVFAVGAWKGTRESKDASLGEQLRATDRKIDGLDKKFDRRLDEWGRRFDREIGHVTERQHGIANAVHAHAAHIEVLKTRVTHLEEAQL